MENEKLKDEDFLQQITDKYGSSALLKVENKDYKLIGLSLFNKKMRMILKERLKNS